MSRELPPPFDNVRTSAGLFSRGLGELLIMQTLEDSVLLGNLALEKGQAVLKDRGFMDGVSPAQLSRSVSAGIVGAVCDLPGREWESLTFLGLRHCHATGDRSRELADSILSFEGSVYRGFHLMLQQHVLPAILLKSLATKEHGQGFGVCDLRLSSLPARALQSIYERLNRSIQKYVTVAVEDLALDDDEFQRLFGAYLKGD